MKKIIAMILAAGIAICFSTAQAQDLQLPPLPQETPDTEKIAIVLFNKQQTEQEISELVKTYPGMQLRYIFKEALNGFSVKGSIETLERLAKNHSIMLVSPVNEYEVTNQYAASQFSINSSSENIKLIGGEAVRGIFDEQYQRLTGKGVTIGVIDTGIDYHHPDLRKSYGGGRDLVDGDKDPMETKGIAGKSTMHGTHVAGIIAANGKMKGVAPDAKIIAYRALGPGGAGTTEQVIAAIELAIKDRVDVLNLSLGNSVNGPDLPISLALNQAVDKGITAVTASGNSGPNTWTVGSPGTASKAISVGASTPPMMIPYLTLDDKREKIRLQPMEGSRPWKLDRAYEIVDGGIGKPSDLQKAKGKIVLIQRGKLTFTEKAKNARQAGAVAVIISNNLNGTFMGNLQGNITIPVASVSKKEGEQLKKQAQAGRSFARTILIEEKDILADFSSRGPVTVTWEIKPDVVAPGVAITSTVPGGYLSLQGTSMASPHVAGACALIKQAHPDWGPAQIKASLMNTAKPLYHTNGTLYKTYEQGAGRIQIIDAVTAETLVSPGSIQFGKFQQSDRRHMHKAFVEIENQGDYPKKYSFTIPKKEKGLEWKLPLRFTVGPHEKKHAEITLIADLSVLQRKIEDGSIILNEGANKISIPYLYVLEEPDYPRVMGFQFGASDKQSVYRYEVYLPGGAEEFGIALFDPDNFRFIGYLDWARKVNKGLLKREINGGNLPAKGYYLAKVFAKKAGKVDMIQTYILIS